ncbi:rac GTPase-activating protein 1 isoform X2 [Dunckerocampus dactyliophorus]|uniref:rac GTPase-activating protein 1 isoform X2 n=1 Tax=Dunckerocampus dactyliophorus TaxID=161453 RepID=UPI002406EA29|nr:rac GTPase-activating protein 1 isoform X2 [Dunckerocampus dactyliophorus]
MRRMGESRLIVEELLALCLQRITMEENAMTTELEFVEVVKNLESFRKKWLHTELELKKYKELLVKSDVAKAALEVKLKHARNQLDLEMKKRHKIESDYDYLQRQMQLMCDILVHDSKSSACLNDEQKSLLATFDHKGTNRTLHRSSKRLSAIDESTFLSDISYDRTDDDVDLDTTVIKPLRSRAGERRRSSMALTVTAPAGKRGRGGNISAELPERKTVEKVETIVKESEESPDTGGHVHMVGGITQEKTEDPTLDSAVPDTGGDQTSVWFPCDPNESQVQTEPIRTEKSLKHVFVSKTVIRPEMCLPCGKRIRFGKMALKCRNCRAVAHPECKQKCTKVCSGNAGATSGSETGNTASLEGFAPTKHPRVPPLIVECVKEIERRGLQERGIYRVPGGERQVKELRDRFLGGKTPLQLGKVSDIHVVCGVLKDFLRKLKEPLVTFRLHCNFMEASEMNDEHNPCAAMLQVIAELPKPNRDTLAFLMLHFHKVMQSPQCQMDQNNLSRVFGPTLVGHGTSEPSPLTIVQDTNTQAKVVCRLLSLPEDYWRRVLSAPTPSSHKNPSQGEGYTRFFRPLTSPELSSYHAMASAGASRGRVRNLGNAFIGGRGEAGKRFFTSPS